VSISLHFFPLAFFLYGPMYLLFAGPALLLALWAQMRVKSSFGKWSDVPLRSGWTGAQVAARVCELGGAEGIQIEMTPGQLSDHYDPRERVLRLSADNYNGRSVAAAAIAAHEAGHAIQHATRYPMLALRSAYVPAARFGSGFALPMFIAGIFFRSPPLIFIGIALFSAAVLFQFITLPVEFDASTRAKRVLADSGIISDEEEMRGVRSVLGAAALTYVAATLQVVLTLLYYLRRSGLLGRR